MFAHFWNRRRHAGFTPGRLLFSTLAVLLALSSPTAAADSERKSFFGDKVEPLLINYCYDCHGDGMKRGDLAFDDFDSSEALLNDQKLWLAVLKNLRADIMPPERRPRPSAEEMEFLEAWIKGSVFRIDPEHPDPGRVTVRRLNRVEYRNTVRDLMGIDFNAEVEFPPDDTGHGFDNIADVLSISPLLLEKYLEAAVTIVDEAVPVVSSVIPQQRFGGRAFRTEDGSRNGERMSFYEDARVSRNFTVTQPGSYRVSVEVQVRGAFDFDPGRCRVEFTVDGEERFSKELAWQEGRRWTYEFDEEWSAGGRELAFELQALTPADERRNWVDFRILSVRVEGPLDEKYRVAPENYARFFPNGPAPEEAEERDQYARELLRDFAFRAFRRPPAEPTVDRLVSIARSLYEQPDRTFEEGIARGMVAVLASPRFIFRLEEPGSNAPPDAHPYLDDFSLASRLSYFFWSSMPDEELFRLAERGELRRNLRAQAQRLFEDPKSRALVRNFTGQWLQARDVEFVPINARRVLNVRGRGRPRVDFGSDMRRDMRRETEMYVGYVMREDRTILELIDSNYTFLNQRLAEHYNIPGVEGNEIRRVELPENSPYGGVLTQGAVLTVTSNPTQTSPVKRGLFILENILGTPPPPAPPDIPELDEVRKEFKDREPTMRELVQLHTSNRLCASCHSRMDPLGMAFENFNALGMWRETEFDQVIDASGRLITGESFNDIRGLKRVLTNERRLDFYRCLTEKLLIYALGRGLEYYDVHHVDQIVERLEKEEGRFSALLMGIIESAPFKKQRNPDLLTAGEFSPTNPTSELVQTRAQP